MHTRVPGPPKSRVAVGETVKGRASTVLGCRQIFALVLGLTAVAGLGLSPGRLCAEPRVDIGISPPPSLKPRAPVRRPASEPLPEDTLDAATSERRPPEHTEDEEGDERDRPAA